MVATPTMVMDKFPDFSRPGFNVDAYNRRFHNSNVVIRASATSVDYPLHWTPLSLKCVLNGEEHYETANGHYVVDADHFLVFNNGRIYSSWIDSPSEVHSLTLNIAPAFEQMALRSMQVSTSRLLDDPFNNVSNEFRFTERLYRHGGKVTSAMRHSHGDHFFYELLESLIDQERITLKEIERAATKKEIFQRLVRARDYIHSCYQDQLTIDELADVACMNAFHFLRQFRKVFGVTPHQLLTQRRMEVGMNLLRSTRKSISDICLDVGFIDPSSFSKLFRSYYGLAPSAFRT